MIFRLRRKVQEMESSSFEVLESLHSGENVALEGKVFDVSMRETKNGNIMCDFLITDYTDSISCRIFLKPDEDLKITLNDWIKVTGVFEADRFSGEYYINTKKVDKIEPKEKKRIDNAE